MKLTDGILKSVDSSFHQSYNNDIEFYVCKYKGKIMNDGYGKFKFDTKSKAEKFIKDFVYLIFWQGEYWQQYKDNIKKQSGYDVDYTATIKILPQYGLTSRFELPENKKMFKDIAKNLVKDGIITIEKISL